MVKTTDSVFETHTPKGDKHQKEKEEIDQGDLQFDAIMTNNKNETDSDYGDAIDPINDTGAANDIQRESLESKMSSLVSSISNSALKQRHPIVLILIVQIVLK